LRERGPGPQPPQAEPVTPYRLGATVYVFVSAANVFEALDRNDLSDRVAEVLSGVLGVAAVLGAFVWLAHALVQKEND
jgi:hypothetical protein